jgi:hypothetical protein
MSQNDPALAELERRLAVVRDRVRGVARGHHAGFYLFGRPGVSKTFTVRTTLDGLGLPYAYHAGHLTPVGLFELLEENADRVLVLDDVGHLLGQQVGLQLLLAALGNQPDGGGERVVRYRRQGRDATVRFTGGIVMVSNLELHDTPVLEALKSRVHVLRYDPTDEQVAALMRLIASKGWPASAQRVPAGECLEVAEFLIGESRRLAVRLDLRLLVDKSFPDYLQWREGHAETNWKDLVLTTLEERLVELRHTPPPRPRSREERLEEERRIVREIVAIHGTREARLAAWNRRMGGGASERRFYRRLAEVEAAGDDAA